MRDKSSWFRAGVLSLAASGVLCANANASSGPCELEVRALPDKSGQYDLHLALKNVGNAPLRLFKAGLPWGNSRSMYLVAVKNRTPLDAPTPIDDPVAGEIELQPGQTVNGEINLVARFPKITELLNQNDIDVLWTYQVITTDGAIVQRLGGWVPITQTKHERIK